MSIKRFFVFFLIIAMLGCNAVTQKLPDRTTWEGKLNGVRVVLKISLDSITNNKVAVFDSPELGIFDIAVSKLILNKDSLIAFSKVTSQGFIGTFNADKNEVQGYWDYSGNKMPLVLTRIANMPSPKRPQTPKAPFPYIVRDVIFYNKTKSIQFGGTLTVPDLSKKYPTVIMITGSGQQDRDETANGHKLFWVIADYLSKHGIAVLRVDDRGTGNSTGNFIDATSFDFANDVLVAVDYLKSQAGIDPKKIGLIGHSEGGLIGQIAVTKSKDIAFLVSLAGIGIKGSELMLSQGRTAYKKAGLTDAELLRIDTLGRMFFRLSEEHKEIYALKPAFKKEMKAWIHRQPEPFLMKAGFKGQNADKALESRFDTMFTPWMRYIILYDPADFLPNIKVPVLALNGEKDVQVHADQNLAGFNKYLNKVDNKTFRTIAFPGLNHFFQHAKTGDMNEYHEIEETISLQVMETMVKWISAI